MTSKVIFSSLLEIYGTSKLVSKKPSIFKIKFFILLLGVPEYRQGSGLQAIVLCDIFDISPVSRMKAKANVKTLTITNAK
jgi:hypothetical protein